jgi:hypothetical protein
MDGTYDQFDNEEMDEMGDMEKEIYNPLRHKHY